MNYAQKAKELVSKMTLAEKTSQLRYDAPAIERLGVPAYNWWNEALHGVARSGAATVFPQAIGMAASFDSELLNQVADAISTEGRAKYNRYKKFGDTDIYQGLTFWSPNINIFRDPRWGRGHETYGEDPYLTSVMGAAFVDGIQGKDPDCLKANATLKHYAVHSGPEGERHTFNAEVSKKDLYETYLSAFEYIVKKKHPAAVMGAYNRVYGEACCASKLLLGKILRGEFGFGGYVVSDCGAICDINRNHHITKNEAESAALAVKNGCDLNCGSAYHYLVTAVGAGLISEEDITVAAERLFEARYRLGMFGECKYDAIPYEVVECPEHIALSRKMAQESIVLLKNNGILPLHGQKTIAVIGPNAAEYEILIGNYNGTPSRYTTLLDGIQQKCDALGIRSIYARGCHVFKADESGYEEKKSREALIAADYADAVIFIGGLNPRMEGEEGDAYNGARSGDRDTIELPDSQKMLLEKLIARGKPVVFVNVSGSCVNLSYQDKECAAVLQCFYPGAEGGHALADILFGEVSPSGRLPVTFYASDSDIPAFEDYSMKERTYRYFTGKPLYPFGYGLSYTAFAYSDIALTKRDGGSVSVTFELANVGTVSGSEVIQAYLVPDDTSDGAALKRLVAFTRAELEAGEEKQCELVIDAEQLLYVGDDGKRFARHGGYTLEINGNKISLVL